MSGPTKTVHSDPMTGPTAFAIALDGGKEKKAKAAPNQLGSVSTADLLAQLKARLSRQLSEEAPSPGKPATQVTKVEEADVQAYMAAASRVLALQTAIRKDSDTLRNPPSGILPETIQERQRRNELAVAELKPIVAELGQRPGLIEVVEVRSRQREQAEKMTAMMHTLTAPNGASVAGLVTDALNGRLIKATEQPTDEEVSFTWFTEGAERTYICTVPEDVVISESVETLADLVQAFKARSEERKDRSHAEVVKYLVSTRRSTPTTYDSELDLLKESSETVRNLPEFFGGKGVRCFIPVTNDRRTNPRTGEPEFLGEALLERAEAGGYISRRITQENGAHLVFGFFKKGEPWKEAGPVKFSAVKKAAQDGTVFYDFPGLKSNLLLTALIAKVKRDQESKAKRDEADNLRDVSKIQNPITWAELRSGDMGTTPVSIMWEEGGKKMPLTFHLEGDGNRFRVSAAVEGTYTKAGWLKPFAEWTPLDRLDTDRNIRVVHGLNSRNERDWVLNTQAAKYGATIITVENIEALVDLEKGADGVYALPSSWFNRTNRRWSSLGYVVKRTASTVEVFYAVPGTSELVIRDEGNGPHNLAELQPRIRAIFRNAYVYLNGLRGKEGQELVPMHLRTVSHEGAEGSDSPADNGHE